MIYFAFGLLSFFYNVGLRCFIVIFIGGYLIEWFYLPGLFITGCVAVFYARRPLRQTIAAITSKIENLFTRKSEGNMATKDQTTNASSNNSEKPKPRWRRMVPASIALLVLAVLATTWSASVGNYGSLIAIPGREAIIRAPESATLIALDAQPGAQLASGARIGRMGNFDLEEQLVQAQSDLARANADYDRLLGELRMRSETAARAELLLRQRHNEFDEINNERR